MRILLICDEPDLVKYLEVALREYYLESALTKEDGCFMSSVNTYDLIILALESSRNDSVELCRSMRNGNENTPILMLTNTCDVSSKVFCLDAGADDYLTVPFSESELLARIRALIRRRGELLMDPVLEVDDLVLDSKSRIVRRCSEIIILRNKEFDILEFLLRNKGRIVSKERLLCGVWKCGWEININTVEVHISNLREKLNFEGKKDLIRTVYGLGYRIEA